MENEVLSQELNESLVNSDDDLFADIEETEDQPVEEPEIEAKPEEPFLKIQYDKQEYGLSREEAKDLAEKGKNYDRMRDKYNNLYESLDKLAKLNDLSVDDYLGRLNSTQFDYMVNKEFEKLKEKDPNASDEILMEIAQRRVNESVDLRQKKAEEDQSKEADAQFAKLQKEVEMFMEEYPEYREQGPEVLDPMVFNYVDQGYTLLEAYNKWLRNNPEVKAKEQASKLNETNKKRSLGSTTNAGKQEYDDFLSGFMNG